MKKFICVIAIIIASIVILTFVIPLMFAMSPLFSESINEHGQNTLNSKQILNALFYTIKEAFFSMIVSMVIGIPCAYFVANKNFIGRRFLLSLSSIPLCVPTLLVALSYVQFFGMNGFLNRFLCSIYSFNEKPIQFLYSFYGIIICQGFYNFPIVMKLCADSWATIDQNQITSAKLLGANPVKCFFTITIYQLASAIITSGLLVFIYCFFSFVIVLLFGAIGGTTIEVEIYQAVKNTLNYQKASYMAIIECVLILGITFTVTLLQKKSDKCQSKGFLVYRSKKMSILERAVLILIQVLITIFLIAPFIVLFIHGITGFEKIFTLKQFYLSWLDSIKTAILTAILSMLTSLVLVIFFRKNKHRKGIKTVKILTVLPMSISSIVLGFGMIMLFQNSGYNASFITLSFLQASLMWPMSYRIVQTAMDKISDNIDTLCLLYSGNWVNDIFLVYLPLLKKSLYTAFAFSFAVSIGDTNLPLILSIPDYLPLSLYTFRLASSYQFEASCASGVVLMFTGIILFIGERNAKNR